MSLNLGDPAPSFSLPNSEGKLVSLADFAGQWLVIFFYPRDNTPGCTTEACGFRDHYDRLQGAGVALLGINTDNEKSHQKFINKYNLPFPLLCDSDAAVATRYESYGLKKFMGKEFMGIFRKSFIIDPSGNIAKIYPKVKPANHSEEVLTDLTALQGTAAH
ncbi:MAG: thioredoxin-dependent thiol peroxidase [Prochlorotrichaceae cyanobacterium]|jgi:peroxiredoxin Q/BCP